MADVENAPAQPMDVEKVGAEMEAGIDAKNEKNENAEALAGDKAEEAAAIKEEVPKKMVPASKIKLRLDDGTLCSFVVESKETSLMTPDEAHKAGLLKENHLLKIQAFLCEVHAKLPNEGPLKRYVELSNSRCCGGL